MTYPRQVLNKIRWGADGLSDVVVTYVHRGGGPDDLARVNGRAITGLGRSFFIVNEGNIPYHRIVRIDKDGEVVFQI